MKHFSTMFVLTSLHLSKQFVLFSILILCELVSGYSQTLHLSPNASHVLWRVASTQRTPFGYSHHYRGWQLAAVDRNTNIKEARQSNKRRPMAIKHIRMSAPKHQRDFPKWHFMFSF